MWTNLCFLTPFLVATPDLVASEPRQQELATTPKDRAWTLLFYGASDNDSEESFGPDLEAARRGIQPQSGVEVLALCDRSPRYSTSTEGFDEDFSDTRLYRLTDEGSVRVSGGEAFPEITTRSNYEASSGSAGTLGKAIRWMKAEYPAQRYGVIFYSHGAGPNWCPDETDADSLFPAELTEELQESDSVDLIIFDVCLMAGVENAYQWRPDTGLFGADIMVATPNAGFPFPWQRILSRIGPEGLHAAELTASDLGALVVEETRAHRFAERGAIPPQHPAYATLQREAMVCLDLSQVEPLKQALDALARNLHEEEGREDLEAVRGSVSRPSNICYAPQGEGLPYFDLHAVASALASRDGASQERRERALGVCSALERTIVSSYGMDGYRAAGGFQSGYNGLYVIIPDGGNDRPASLAGMDWYSPLAVDGDDVYGCYAFCRDGAEAENGAIENWFELMDSWYDPGGRRSGGVNGYQP